MTSPRSPLAGFHPAVAAWFRSVLGAPTTAQSLAWDPISKGKTTLLLAPTGSGKTLAAFLSAIDRLVQTPLPATKEEAKSRLRVLYVSPLKALAVDVEKNLRAPLAGIARTAAERSSPLRDLEVGVRTGDTEAGVRAKMARTPPDILITTPESLYLLLTSKQAKILASVETVIIDEIHQMAATKRGAHLFLSLERLEALREGKPLQRIGLSATQRPLDEIARLLGGYRPKGRGMEPRPVAIVDASAKKTITISVEMPEPRTDPRATEAPDQKSVWPDVHARLVERIRAARSTMIFVNSRRLAERLAAALNEVAGVELALAHHGSVAKETRRAIEERLKEGSLPAIVATSSLELGIDMGAVDQVILVEAPPSVASGIQRIGRASHHVGGIPLGVLVPKHKHDLLACAAAAAGIEDGDVEETFYPRNPLDVLAQHIVAMAAVGIGDPDRTGARRKDTIQTSVDDLFRLVRSAAPFAELPRASFEGVLDMLSGRYPSEGFVGLRPRITWNRARGIITPRSGAQRLAILNAGTIPDRGLYGVFVMDSGPSKGKPSRRVGELDEEMVFELREGEVFLLGASSWRAEEITRDRVLVSPAAGLPGKMPFWHGDRAGRTTAFGKRIGKLARSIAEMPPADARRLLATEHHLDAPAARTLIDYVRGETAAIGTLPSDRTIVVERIPDELGDLRICVLSPFGTRVHAPWAMAALRRLRNARSGDIEAVWSDDGIIFRVPGGETPPDTSLLFPPSDEIDDLVTRELGTSSLFAARFREAAGRALLLPRQAVGRRTPLWAQRKRAADLLAVATEYPSFPIVLETYRECLRDAFDLPGLTDVLRAVESRKIRVTTVDAPVASPFAASLLFAFVGNFIYDSDAPAAERRAQALTIDHAQLRELLGEIELRKLLDAEVIAAQERSLLRLDRPLRHADDVHDLLLWLGDTTEADLAARIEDPKDLEPWLRELLSEGRILRVKTARGPRLIAAEDAGRYRDALGIVLPRDLPDAFAARTTNALLGLVTRHAKTHGPFPITALSARWGITDDDAREAVSALAVTGKLTTGAFLPNGTKEILEACDPEVLATLRRKTLALLRKAIEPVDAAAFTRFLVDWQGIATDVPRTSETDAGRSEALLHAVAQLSGCPLPASVLESEILPARVPGYAPYLLDQLLATGEVVWAGIEPVGSHDGRIALYLADQEPLLARPSGEARPEGPLYDRLRELFERRGAVFFSEIARTLGVFPNDILKALWDLVWAGEVTNDTFEPLRTLGQTDERRGRRPRPIRSVPRGSEGRWSLRSGRTMTDASSTERAMALARTLLDRYGVVLREAPSVESIVGGFANVYDVYRALEDQGRVRRGYFVAGRGATQFALPGAEERLRDRSPSEGRTIVLAATDPANPYGALLPWPDSEARNAQRVPGAHVVIHHGRLLAWVARGGESVVTFLPTEEPEASRAADILARTLAGQARGHVVVVSTIDGVPARQSRLSAALVANGFAERGGTLTRIPLREHLH